MFDFMQSLQGFNPMQSFQDFYPAANMQQFNPIKGLLGMTSNQPFDAVEPFVPQESQSTKAPFDWVNYDWGLGAPQKAAADQQQNPYQLLMQEREQDRKNKIGMGIMGFGNQIRGLGNQSHAPMPMPMPQMQMPQMQQRGAIPMPYSPFAKPMMRR